jgi:Ser/Thr protein kinase RdoA (MazF antagonist)
VELTDPARVRDLVGRFDLDAELDGVEPLPGGHINESYVATCRLGRGPVRFLLQGLNPDVFPDARRVMENVARVTEHLWAVLAGWAGPDAGRRALRLVPAREGTAFVEDQRGRAWRLYRFIEDTVTRQQPTGAADVERAARAFGTFQRDVASLPGPRLHETIPHFHDTPRRVEALEHAVECDVANRAAGAREAIARVLARSDLAPALVDAAARGELPERVVHNDAKISNVLFDASSGEALCVVDLDTVMPGLSLYDFGDLVRSMAARAAEDECDLRRVRLEPELFAATARGYLAATGDLLSVPERELLVPAAQVIVYEQAARFLTDHLNGDRYYRIARPDQNLDRCRSQLALLESLLAQEPGLTRIAARV